MTQDYRRAALSGPPDAGLKGPHYNSLKATMGSTFVARRAGT